MRSLRKSWIGIVLVFLFGISLLFWRQSSYVSNIFNSDNVIAKVGSMPISTTRFNRALQMNIHNFNKALGRELTGEEIRNFQIYQLALSAIINEAVFENEFNELNFKLDETIIAKKTKEIVPQLYKKNNELDENYLNQFLSQQRLKVEDLVQIFHFDARNEYFNSAFLNINYPSSFSNNIEIYDNQSRDIKYLKIPINLIDISKVSNENELDNVLTDFFQDNISKYMSDEKRDIEYILIDRKDLRNSFIPSINEIIEYYNDNTGLFIDNEKRSFIQFNFKTSDKANKFKKSIKSLITYEEVISYADKEKIKFNVFDNLSKNEVLEEIANPLFELNINEQSPVIISPIAHHIIILKKIEPKKQLSFEEAEDNIVNTISNTDVNNYLIDLENKISQEILDGFSLKEIAKKNELKLLLLKNITLNSNELDERDSLFFNSIIKKAFSANLNFTNDIVKLNQDLLYTYEVVNITDSKPLNYIDIKDIIYNDWKRFNQIEEIVSQIKNNNANPYFLENLEKKFGKKIQNLSITSSNTAIPKELVLDVLTSNLDTVVYKVDKNEIHLSKILKVNLDKQSNKINNISLNNEIRNALYNELLKMTKISTNDQLLESILNSY